MPNFSPILNGFNAGEFAPVMYGRSDLEKYRFGARLIENFWILPQGGLIRRSGSRFVSAIKDETKVPRLVRWSFSTDDAYILLFEENSIRFFTNEAVLKAPTHDFLDAAVSVADPGVFTIVDHRYVDQQGPFQLESTGTLPTGLNLATNYFIILLTTDTFSLSTTADGLNPVEVTAAAAGGTHTVTVEDGVVVPHEVTTTYTEAQLYDMTFAQSADFLYIAHADHESSTLIRNAAQDWVLTTGGIFNDGPYLPQNEDIDNGMSISATSGTVTLVTDKDTFIATDDDSSEGRLVRISDDDENTIGWGNITTFTNTQTATATVLSENRFQTALTTNTNSSWRLGAFSLDPTIGFPRAVGFFEGRLCWSGNTGGPDTFYASKTGVFDNYAPTTRGKGTGASNVPSEALDSSGLTFTIASGELNQCFWMSPLNSMIMGLSGSIYSMDSGGDNLALSPTNVRARLITNVGSSKVQPAVVASEICYVTQFGRRLYGVRYEAAINNHLSEDLTILSSHILKSGVKQVTFAQDPNGLVSCVRNDGEIASLTILRQQDVLGWSRQKIGGSFSTGNAVVESAETIPDPTENYHQTWLSVKRTIDGNTRRYIEFFEENFDTETPIVDAFFVDSGLSYDISVGGVTDTIANLDHLEGETLQILADGAPHPDRVVTGGSITLQAEYQDIHAGLSYDSNLESLNINTEAAGGSLQGKTQRVISAVLRLDNTVGGKMGHSSSDLNDLPGRREDDAMDEAVTPVSLDEEILIDDDPDFVSITYVRQDQALPMTIIGIIPKVSTGSR